VTFLWKVIEIIGNDRSLRISSSITPMRFTSILLVFLSAAAHAALSYFIKQSKDKQMFCLLYLLTAVVIFAPVPLYYLLFDPVAFPPLSPLLLAAGLLHAAYMWTLAEAYHGGDLSLVYPIVRSHPAFVLVGGAIFLGEKVSPLGASGVLLTVAGVYILCMKSFSLSSFVAPLTEVFRTPATRYALLTSCIATAYTLIDKVFVSTVPPLLYAYIFYAMIAVCLTLQLVRRDSAAIIRAEILRSKGLIILCALLDVFGYLLILIAFRMDKVGYVVGMRQMSILIAVLMGGLLLQETDFRHRLTASIVIFAGVLLISLSR
jgi:drug/metabolite transporter (DMT)-like permease